MFQTISSNDFGRYLVATSDIPAKASVLLEDVILHAPADNVKDKIKAGKTSMCLACCHEGISRKCSSCGWYICSEDCEKMPCHTDECLLFTENKVKFPPPHGWPILNKTILVLRCLFMKISNTRVWTDFLCKLEHHSKARSKKLVCIKGDNMIVENIKYFYDSCECPFTEKEMRMVCGVLNVNAFFAENTDEISGISWKAKCLFENASLFAHSCSPNCSWAIKSTYNEEFKRKCIQIHVETAIPIRKGEMLTIFYSTRYALQGSLKRIVLMEEIAHFVCKCNRCSDKTELLTFMSAQLCLNCEQDYVLPEEPTNIHSNWKCSNSLCERTIHVNEIVSKVCQIEDCVERIESQNLSVKEKLNLLQRLIDKTSGILLHPNHYALQEMSTRIIQLLVENEEGILNENKPAEVNLPFLELFIGHCKYLLNVAYIILPAMTGYIDTLETYLQKAESIRKIISGLS